MKTQNCIACGNKKARCGNEKTGRGGWIYCSGDGARYEKVVRDAPTPRAKEYPMENKTPGEIWEVKFSGGSITFYWEAEARVFAETLIPEVYPEIIHWREVAPAPEDKGKAGI